MYSASICKIFLTNVLIWYQQQIGYRLKKGSIFQSKLQLKNKIQILYSIFYMSFTGINTFYVILPVEIICIGQYIPSHPITSPWYLQLPQSTQACDSKSGKYNSTISFLLVCCNWLHSQYPFPFKVTDSDDETGSTRPATIWSNT
jgi:hypothetical protein